MKWGVLGTKWGEPRKWGQDSYPRTRVPNTLSLVFRDASGTERHVIRNLYDLEFSADCQGGPIGLIAVTPIDLVKPIADLLHDVSLYDGFEEIWLGRVKEIPRVTVSRQAAAIVCEGPVKHLEDDRYKPAYAMPKTYDAIVKDVLTSKCPKISTDQTQIAAGTYSIQKFDVTMSTTPRTLVERAMAFEGFDWGFWDRGADNLPRLTSKPHDRGVVDYYVSLKNCRPDLSGRSIEELYNKAYALYGDFAESVRTAANPTLDGAALTRAVSLSESSLNQTDAERVADTYLASKSKPQGKGQLEIRGIVRDRYGRMTPAYRILPGRNIFIYDLEVAPADLDTITSADVLNGKNCFKVTEMDGSLARLSAQVQVEVPADRLDIMLARLGASA
ncbi:MAG: hypothetical protein M1548_01920 [Actinobacteria bacterium]|nr:hypothetical protein [Actinomycetota bacterium]